MRRQYTVFEPATLHYQWRDGFPATRFTSAVSLHSHTLHSRELLDFIPHLCDGSRVRRRLLEAWNAHYRTRWGRTLDYSRAWWTPPVCATQALTIERRQIEALGLMPIVSITDHDNIDAARLLSMTSAAGAGVWSVEWTVPTGNTFLHVGVHNIPQGEAEAKFAAMKEFTSSPLEHRLPELLEWFCSTGESLVILNHPLWDEKQIGSAEHLRTVESFLTRYRPFLHALELNGLRSWKENCDVIELARRFDLPAISGGDRHSTEPNATLNLTNATRFEEFADEVRRGRSEVLFMPQYRQARTLRLLHNVQDVVGEHPGHSLGWTHICDRVFHLCDDGSVKSLTQILGGRSHGLVHMLMGFTRLVRQRPVQSALRMALGTEEVV